MPIVSVERLWTGRGGSDTFSRRRTYSEQWEVITDDPADDEEVVAGAPAAALGLPRLGQPHVRYPVAVCVEISPEQSDESPFRWLVSLKYDSQVELPNGTSPDGASQSPESIPENPLLRPATWELSFETTTEPATHWRPIDANGNLAAAFVPIRNSAKMPFDPPLQIEVSRPVYRVTKAIPAISTAFVSALENALNDRPWRGLAKWCAKIRGVRSASKYENSVSFVELSLEIAIKKETWVPSILDAGLHEYSPGSQTGDPPAKITKIVDPRGGEGPYLLNGSGRRLAADGTPVFLRGLPANFQLQNFAALLNL